MCERVGNFNERRAQVNILIYLSIHISFCRNTILENKNWLFSNTKQKKQKLQVGNLLIKKFFCQNNYNCWVSIFNNININSFLCPNITLLTNVCRNITFSQTNLFWFEQLNCALILKLISGQVYGDCCDLSKKWLLAEWWNLFLSFGCWAFPHKHFNKQTWTKTDLIET